MAVTHATNRNVVQDVNLAIPNDPEPGFVLISLWNPKPVQGWGAGGFCVDSYPDDVPQGDPSVVEDDQLLSEPLVSIESLT